MASELPPGDTEAFRELLAEAVTWHMPFGKYGPDHYPPHGVPLIDLPPEYLGWFKQRGFPGGKLGQMMELIYEAKIHGADHVFAPLRSRRGGRTDLREKKKAIRRNHRFSEPG
jgi:uncharacterized protein (DUF3820 family)